MKPFAAVPTLVIFDCDGVLVDSEVISASVMAQVLAEQGLPVDEDFVYRHFLGRSMPSAGAVLRERFAYTMGEPVIKAIRDRLQARLKLELQAVPGVRQALEKIPAAKCVASSSRPERLDFTLAKAGLLDFFAPDIFSSTMVANGKPAPDLFLYAAARMGHEPANCVVIEDSPAGVIAAKAAGMRVMGFTGAAHAGRAGLKTALAQLAPDVIFDDMRRLPDLLG